jgi:O-antigen biosynthesis protein
MASPNGAADVAWESPRMHISVFTPSHDSKYLGECYRSLISQSHSDWEWVVVLNRAAVAWRPPAKDERVKVVRAPAHVSGVGAIKRFACELTQGELLVELDHDDILSPACLSEVAAAFRANPEAALVYSDFAQINADGSPNMDRFDPSAGWVYTDERVGSTTYLRCHAMAAYPHNVGYIWYAPNHVRAFRRTSYDEAGGYNPDRRILDDQELMAQLFEMGEFVHIDRLLYFQRVHPKNTQSAPKTNAQIQTETVALYDRTIRSLASAWAARRRLSQIRLITATSPPTDEEISEDVVVIDPERPVLAHADDSVGVIKMIDLLQRVPDRVALLNECFRALCHGGLIITQTPSTDGRGAFQDPSHVSFWNENSFWYLTQAALRFAVPALACRLQISRVHTGYPTGWHEEQFIPYVYANLIAIKDGPRQGGPLLA